MAGARYEAVFASDVHLSAEHPATTDAFLAFVGREVDGATPRFFVLGDLFEAWAGDDDLDDPLARRVVDALHRIAERGTSVAFIAGNRDFLVAERFADAARMRLLPDPYETTIEGTKVLLSHGDALCTDDVDYQRFRTMVREPAWQADFLAKPIAARRAMVAGARRESEHAKAGKATTIMDVNADAVRALLARHPGATLVHGHTHRPGHHWIPMGDVGRERWVLPDWDAEAEPPRGGGLALVGGKLVRLPLG